jgi:hypothetical protein
MDLFQTHSTWKWRGECSLYIQLAFDDIDFQLSARVLAPLNIKREEPKELRNFVGHKLTANPGTLKTVVTPVPPLVFHSV